MFDDIPGTFAIPIRFPEQPRDFASLWIENDRCRQAQNTHFAREKLFGILMAGQRSNPRLGKELLDPGRRIAPCRNRDNGKALAAQCILQCLKLRHFLAAGRAPCGPEIEDDKFTVVIGHGAGARPVGQFKGGLRGTARLAVKVQLFQVAIAHGFARGDLRAAGQGRVCTEREGQIKERGSKKAHVFSNNNRPKMTDKDANQMWGGRFAAGPDAIMEAINASIGFDQRLAAQDIAGSRAHAAMLAAQGIISDSDAEAIRKGLLTILSEIEGGTFQFSAALEDIHMNVEARLKEIIGEPAGRLHTGRSRNDQVATDFRLWVRDQADAAIAGLRALMAALITQAEAGADWVMPGFTHLQTAQPVTWGHHMMAYVEMIARDRSRLADARARLNESPLGAAALAGTSFPIDRHMTAATLGFDRPSANSLDAVSDRDFALEYLSAASICATHLSRLAEELVIWSSAQFRFVQLSDAFTTGSSIMPQKRNPDAAELVRAKTGRVFGALIGLLTVMKGLPLAYSKDMQEDKERVFDAADAMDLSLAAMIGMVRDLKIERENLEAAAGAGFSTATDLADWLVRRLNMPFRDAHHVTGTLVGKAEQAGLPLEGLSLAQMQAVEPSITDEVFSVLGPRASVESRVSYGGTSPVRVREQIAAWRARLADEG